MGKMKKNQSGFGTVGIILVIVVVVVIGAVGWFVYDRSQNKIIPATATNATYNTPPTTSTPSTGQMPTYSSTDNYVNVIQKDESITHVTPDKIAKTPDQALILQALHEACTEKTKNVTVNVITFDNNGNFKQVGNYAYINVSICASASNNINDIGGGAAATYLHKNTKTGSWIMDERTQQGVMCSNVDGKGYPKSLIATCFTSDNKTRAPK